MELITIGLITYAAYRALHTLRYTTGRVSPDQAYDMLEDFAWQGAANAKSFDRILSGISKKRPSGEAAAKAMGYDLALPQGANL